MLLSASKPVRLFLLNYELTGEYIASEANHFAGSESKSTDYEDRHPGCEQRHRELPGCLGRRCQLV